MFVIIFISNNTWFSQCWWTELNILLSWYVLGIVLVVFNITQWIFITTLWLWSRFFLILTIKYKEKILKAAREKQKATYKGIPIRLSADFSVETLNNRKEWQDIFKVMKRKNLQPRILYSASISFRFEGEIKSFSNKQKSRIQHYQKSFTTNTKGTPLGRKETSNLKQPVQL